MTGFTTSVQLEVPKRLTNSTRIVNLKTNKHLLCGNSVQIDDSKVLICLYLYCQFLKDMHELSLNLFTLSFAWYIINLINE